MNEQIITIKIEEDGKIRAATEGFVGTECTSELDKLMKDLATSVSRKKKEEYFKEKINSQSSLKVTHK